MVTTDARVEQLRKKYERAMRDMEEQHTDLVQLTLNNGKLHIVGTAKSSEAVKRIQSRFSDVDPNWSREVELDLHAPDALAPNTGQTVVNTSEEFSNPPDNTGESE